MQSVLAGLTQYLLALAPSYSLPLGLAPRPASPLRTLVLFIIRTRARHQAGFQGDKTPFHLIPFTPQRGGH